MLKRMAKFLALFGVPSPFEAYYGRLLGRGVQMAPTADEALCDYRQAMHDAHNWLR